jgi:hypothetical protein
MLGFRIFNDLEPDPLVELVGEWSEDEISENFGVLVLGETIDLVFLPCEKVA